MKKYIKSILAISVSYFFCGALQAQDVSFTQPYNSPLLTNPALMGVNQDLTVSTAYKSQWTGIGDGYKTIRFSAMSPILWDESGKLDAGLYYYNDQAGAFQTNDVGVAASYALKLDKFNTLTVALGGAYKNSQIDESSLTFGDQYIHGNFTDIAVTSEQIASPTSSIIDASYGLLWSFKPAFDSLQFFAGVSGYHFYKPYDNYIQNSEAQLEARFNYVMGLKIRTIQNIDFAPQYMASWQGGSLSNLVGAYADYYLNIGTSNASMKDGGDNKESFNSSVTLGTWYNVNAKTFSFILGLKYDSYALGYSYGFGNGRIKETAFDMGQNEISLSYFLNRTKDNSVSPISKW